jgi:hypothetical protein
MNIVAEENPNEACGVRACSFAGQVKSVDCRGQWYVVPTVRVANPLAPRLVACEFHILEAAKAFATPTVKEIKPKRAPRRQVEELSL